MMPRERTPSPPPSGSRSPPKDHEEPQLPLDLAEEAAHAVPEALAPAPIISQLDCERTQHEIRVPHVTIQLPRHQTRADLGIGL